MFGRKSLFKEFEGVIRQLRDGKRRTAFHARPKSLTENGFESFASPDVIVVFEGFEYFAILLNRQIAEGWTIEETADTHVKDLDSDTPQLGRTYLVYYNGLKLGRMQVTAGMHPQFGIHKTREWHQVNRAARVLLDLAYVRFLPYSDIFSLIYGIELFVGPCVDGIDQARFNASAKATRMLTEHLWEVQAAEDFVPPFEHRAEGPYDLLKETDEHWRANGVDPFEKWSGDKSQ